MEKKPASLPEGKKLISTQPASQETRGNVERLAGAEIWETEKENPKFLQLQQAQRKIKDELLKLSQAADKEGNEFVGTVYEGCWTLALNLLHLMQSPDRIKAGAGPEDDNDQVAFATMFNDVFAVLGLPYEVKAKEGVGDVIKMEPEQGS